MELRYMDVIKYVFNRETLGNGQGKTEALIWHDNVPELLQTKVLTSQELLWLCSSPSLPTLTESLDMLLHKYSNNS